MARFKFCVWDENVCDRTGDRILVAGIDYSDFLKNPVMFYNHMSGYDTYDPKGNFKAIGHWENPSIENGMLYFEGVVDEGSERGAELARLYGEGHMFACSIAYTNATFDQNIPFVTGQRWPTVSSCKLLEISLVDIGAHPNAVIQKSYNKGVETAELFMANVQIEELKKQVLVLEESAKAKEEEFSDKGNKIAELTEKVDKVYTLLEEIRSTPPKRKMSENAQGTPNTKSELSFDHLQKNDPKELARIKQENPALYKQLADEYTKK